MKRKRISAVTLIFIIGAAIGSMMPTSCISDDVTTSSAHVLSFSCDTISFDTIFTDLGTPTARLVVHNRASKAINISSIRFSEPSSYFRMNVDGVSGSDFNNVEIRARDSIYIFIECYIPEQSVDNPIKVEDKIEFLTNGVAQNVLLEAWGRNVTRLRGFTVNEDTRFTTDRPYVIFDSLIVAENATLRIDPGVKMLFHDNAYMRVYGCLEAVGEVGRMIDFRGDRMDEVLPGVNYDIMSGQWRGISIARNSYGNRMEYVDMRSTVSGLQIDSCADLTHTKISIYNSWLHNSRSHVLESSYAKLDVLGCCFSESAGAVVSLKGGEINFLQCTFANNYLFTAIYQPILMLEHLYQKDMEKNDQPLMKGWFGNSIIYGITAGLNIENLTDTDVIMENVSFKSDGSDDANFISCLWDTDPMFCTIREDYYFNYRLKEDSPVKSAGNPALLTPAAMTDMDGINRMSDGNPSLGAYQYTDVRK